VYYPRVVFDYACYLADPRVIVADVPVARSVAARCASLPVHPHLADADIDRIVATVRTVLGA
jgi:dTDP-4-amino-4,6-dideoxygalactose transaminase